MLSGYQVHGAFAHLHQHNNEEVADTLADAVGSSQPKNWDPLLLAIPYKYLSALLFKPPDCWLGQWITLATAILIYMIPLCCRAAYLTYLCLFPPPSKARPRKPNRLHHRCAALATTDLTLRGHTTVSFDTDGIPFIVNNSATCIITNEWSLFVGKLVPVQVQADTIEATQVRHHYEGTMRLELVNDANIKHTYDVPGAIYDPSLKFNLLGILKLANFFSDKNSIPGNDVDSNGTTVKSSGCCSRLTWDHGQHMRNFTHGDSTLPKIILYQGNGYILMPFAQDYSNVMMTALHTRSLQPSPFCPCNTTLQL